jgi:hypothetical protein
LLERQRSGLTGHIEAAGYPFDTCGWACSEVAASTQKWWPYEQTSYYVDGLLRLGYLLDDAELVARARKQTDYVLAHEDAVGGRLGPLHLDDEWWRWPYASFFRTFMTLHAVTGDEGLVAALGRHYLAFSPYDFADDLELANVEELCWPTGRRGTRGSSRPRRRPISSSRRTRTTATAAAGRWTSPPTPCRPCTPWCTWSS